MPDPSLRTRILLLTAVPVIVAALALGTYVLTSRISDLQFSSQHLHRLTVENYAARTAALMNGQEDAFQALMQRLLEEQDVRSATLSHNGTTLAHAGPRMRPAGEPHAGNAGLSANTEAWRTDAGWRWSYDLPDNYQLELEFSAARQRIEILQTLLTVLLSTLGIVLLALVPALHFSRRMSEPVADFTRAVQRIRDGELDTRIESRASGELEELKRAINNMAEALEEAQSELQQNVDQATQDLRETLETIEIQNIELDMARKEALKASRVKSEFLANMSHEIRTPLNGIMGFTRLLLRGNPTPRQKDHLHTIRKSSEALLSIINDILDFSKIEAGKLDLERQPTDLHDIIEEVQTMLAPMAHEKNLEQTAIIYSDVPVKLIADPLRIRQVLTNLVSNAIKFTEQGSVVVRAMLEENRSHLATIRISVTDTGAGISEEKQKELFSAFTQIDQSSARRVGGTGLGLAISKRLAEEMGGEIGVESNPGEGSTFWFTLRVEIDEHTPVTDSFRAMRGKRALLVESNEHVYLGLYHMLARWGVETESVERMDQLESVEAHESPCDFLVLGLSPGSETDPAQIEALQRLSHDATRPMVILCNHTEQLADALPQRPEQCRVMAKPATRLRLYDCLLELASGDTGAPAPREESTAESQHAGLKVMVVDDHPGNLRLASVFLEELGVTVVACDSGNQALAAFDADQFDLVFMDIQMPGMDGMEVTRRMRERERGTHRTPIVALTAHAMASERRELLASGMDDYITKPVTEQHLRHVLDQWLNDSSDRQPSPAPPSLPPAEGDRIFDEALALQRAGGKPDLANEMHRMLLDGLDQDEKAIREAARGDQKNLLLEHVHRLHGATRYCGSPRLEKATRDLEELLKTGHDRPAREAALERLYTSMGMLRDQAPDSITANAST